MMLLCSKTAITLLCLALGGVLNFKEINLKENLLKLLNREKYETFREFQNKFFQLYISGNMKALVGVLILLEKQDPPICFEYR